MDVTVLIPAHNEEGTIAKVIVKAKEHSNRVVVCDDGSTDMTGRIAESLGAEVIRTSHNLGYGAALSTLLTRAKEIGAGVVVTLDGDGQHDPDEIPIVIEPLLKGEADIVIGSRFLAGDRKMPRYRTVGIKAITGLSNSVGDLKVSDAQSGFRAYALDAISSVLPTELGMGASTEILLKASRASLRIVEVPINVSYEKGASRNPVYHGVEVVFATIKHVSILHPLIVYGIPGFAFMLYGLYLGSNALRIYEDVHKVIIGTTLISMGAILVGLILAITALIIWIMISVVRSPLYQAGRTTPA
ncbi:MAG: glycosyltransferase family 2 protein [Nitrososphaerota archaeon]|nr:glycosyltransferase family 2 protein [Nitrososphaerota archaeon]MDG6942093.1 glycosyltransferase family 2 protein [Nitrososphaerota archaeon]MDG6942558.1 glycosyltransferase family 2 protein [Nitrososphaerota archaeon]MDG6948345.1 glycosyltransferase family 2 protein [Nitrososphaerota archaeon]MDG6950271.1 glycosyltransferase family 2 protein [Nitrososphaerota archaeon]